MRLIPLTAVLLLLICPPAALAGKPPSGTSSISGPVMVDDQNGNGSPNYGDTVTFQEQTTATTQPYVNLQCFQNGTLVANGWKGFFDGSLDTNRNFGLSDRKSTRLNSSHRT